MRYELAILPAVDLAVVQRMGLSAVAIAATLALLTSGAGADGAALLCIRNAVLCQCGMSARGGSGEDVRDAEVCVAVVGNFLRDSEKQGFQGCFEGGAAVSEARAGGAGGCGWGGRLAVDNGTITWFVFRDSCSVSGKIKLQQKLVAGRLTLLVGSG